MKTLVVEDDFISGLLLKKVFLRYGQCHLVVNRKQALRAFRTAGEEDRPYDLICLDIMMPEMDGFETINEIRASEEAEGIPYDESVKIIMTMALRDSHNVSRAFQGLCDAYLFKPIDRSKLLSLLLSFGLLESSQDESVHDWR
jgi:two-component system chemotaxis response regulator CheY